MYAFYLFVCIEEYYRKFLKQSENKFLKRWSMKKNLDIKKTVNTDYRKDKPYYDDDK